MGNFWNPVHSLVGRAIAAGQLTRPDRCSKCNRRAKRRDGVTAIQAHHDDYDKPLDVIWLCPLCHAARHRELGWGNGGQITGDRRRGKTKEQIRAEEHARFLVEYPEYAKLEYLRK